MFLEQLAVMGKYLGFGDKAHINAVVIDHREVPGAGFVELGHYLFHGFPKVYLGGGRVH